MLFACSRCCFVVVCRVVGRLVGRVVWIWRLNGAVMVYICRVYIRCSIGLDLNWGYTESKHFNYTTETYIKQCYYDEFCFAAYMTPFKRIETLHLPLFHSQINMNKFIGSRIFIRTQLFCGRDARSMMGRFKNEYFIFSLIDLFLVHWVMMMVAALLRAQDI